MNSTAGDEHCPWRTVETLALQAETRRTARRTAARQGRRLATAASHQRFRAITTDFRSCDTINSRLHQCILQMRGTISNPRDSAMSSAFMKRTLGV